MSTQAAPAPLSYLGGRTFVDDQALLRELFTAVLAASEGEEAVALHERFGEYQWLSTYRPVRRVGKSIRLYYIPE